MSSRARRVRSAQAEPFGWGGAARPPASPDVSSRQAEGAADSAVVEREAFLKGYAQGEKAGAEAAATRAEAMLRRLRQTIDELAALRSDMIHRTERQMVQLALAIARRVVQREISLDRGLLVGMARVALDRLGEHASATVRLHPDDYAVVTAGAPPAEADAHVRLVADPLVGRGSCLVQSDFGFMDVSPQAQFEELARALLDDAEPVPAGPRMPDVAPTK